MKISKLFSSFFRGCALFRNAAGAAFMALSLVGCSMVDSTEFRQAMSEFGCKDDNGAYFLSKSMIRIQVTKFGNKDIVVDKVEVRAVPDQRHGYCLDYRASPLHKEKLHVVKTNGLLQQVTSVAEDQTPDIVNNLVNTVFEGLTRDGRSIARSAVEKGFLTKDFFGDFDPFDEYETALLNDSLNDFGICIMLQEAHWLLRVGYRGVPAYCEDPLDFIKHDGGYKDGGMKWRAIVKDDRKIENAILDSQGWRESKNAFIPYTKGILYRPRLTYTLMVYVKKNFSAKRGEGNAEWRLRKQKAVPLENIAPILAIGVDRTFFAKRKATLSFNAGALTDVDIEKGSELVGFVAIPLNLVQQVVKLPTKIIQVKINSTNNRSAIIEAQTQLIALETARQTAAQNLAKEPNVAALAGLPRSGQFPQSIARSGSALSVPACKRQLCGGLDQQRCDDFCDCVVNQCLPSEGNLTTCRRAC